MGSGSGPLAITTRSAKNIWGEFWLFGAMLRAPCSPCCLLRRECSEPIVSYQSRDIHEHGLMRTIKPIELLVPVSFTHRCASTSGLSTWWSSTALKGMLVLKEASCLDAFSSYPVRI